jgi:hypothetical protein
VLWRLCCCRRHCRCFCRCCGTRYSRLVLKTQRAGFRQPFRIQNSVATSSVRLRPSQPSRLGTSQPSWQRS